MSSKPIVLITGANTGLGFEIVRAVYGSDKAYQILLGGRSSDKAVAARQKAVEEAPESNSSIDVVQIDIEDDASIQALYKTVDSKYGKVDVLINNAGASFDSEYKAGRMTEREAWNQSWALNVTSTHIMTETFMSLLIKSNDPRLIFIASGTSSFRNCEMDWPINKSPPKGWPKDPETTRGTVPAYRSSKTGMNMMMREWHRTLKGDGVKVWAISPGLLATGLGGNPAALRAIGAAHPSIGGKLVKEVIEGVKDALCGSVVGNNHLGHDAVQPW